MSEVFRSVLNAGFQSSIVILMVLLLRLVLKKAPKKYTCLLWILVGIRLLVPFSLESRLSLQPDLEEITKVRTEAAAVQQEEIQMVPAVPQDAQLPEDVEVFYGDVFEEPIQAEIVTGETAEEEQPVMDWYVVGGYVWIAAALALLAYSLISYLLLKRRVREAVHLFDDVWECAGVDTAFILGFLRPRIYIPMGISKGSCRYILEHERTHMKRGDHWVKLIGFIALAFHWFNPLVWVAYTLLCRDMEMACDEAVVQYMSLEERKSYSAALLDCSSSRTHWAACPVAFGEVSVKQRILSVLNYRRPAFWFSVAAVIAVIFVAVCFLTDPAEQEIPAGNDEWEDEIRAVLEDIQSRESGYIIEQRKFEGNNVLNDSADINYFRFGDAWLEICVIDDLAENAWSGSLYLDGTYYESVSDTGVFEWQQSEVNEDYTAPWLYSFDLDAQQAAAISWQSTDEGYEIRLKVQAPYHDLGASYHVNFSFDHDGNFRNAVLYASGMVEVLNGQSEQLSITTVMYAPESTKAEITKTMAKYAATLDRDFDIYLGSATLEAPDWGIRVTIGDITPTGLTFAFNQTGELIGQELFYGQSYSLERWTGSGWEAVEPIIDNGAFTMEAILLPQNQTTRLDINWDWLYGELPAGTYRIGKSVSNKVYAPIGVNISMADQPEELDYTYYAVFEIKDETDGGRFRGNALGTLLKDWDGEIAYVQLRSDVGQTSLSGERELAEVIAMLEEVCYDPNRISQVTETRDIEEYRWYYSSIELGSGAYLIFDDDCESVWAVSSAGATAVYGVEDPAAVRMFFARSFDGVVDEPVTAAPFAGGDEPWLWAQKISMDAVEEIRLYTAEQSRVGDSTVTVTSSSGVLSASRFEELLDILNTLEKDVFAAKDKPGKHTLLELQSGFGDEQGITLTIIDGANRETVILRLVADEVELVFCGDLEGARKTEYLSGLRCWTVENEPLLAYLRELMEHPYTIHYWPVTE